MIRVALAAGMSVSLLVGGYWLGVQHTDARYIAEQLKLRNKQDELTQIVKDRDLKLAELQQAAETKRNDEVVKYKVVYEDRIKTVTVYQCVADSGLLDLYDVSHGVK